jgi:NAD(P)-dependent dehydrogenase (short-subunit alcohol dehydrogenase family)
VVAGTAGGIGTTCVAALLFAGMHPAASRRRAAHDLAAHVADLVDRHRAATRVD